MLSSGSLVALDAMNGMGTGVWKLPQSYIRSPAPSEMLEIPNLWHLSTATLCDAQVECRMPGAIERKYPNFARTWNPCDNVYLNLTTRAYLQKITIDTIIWLKGLATNSSSKNFLGVRLVYSSFSLISAYSIMAEKRQFQRVKVNLWCLWSCWKT